MPQTLYCGALDPHPFDPASGGRNGMKEEARARVAEGAKLRGRGEEEGRLPLSHSNPRNAPPKGLLGAAMTRRGAAAPRNATGRTAATRGIAVRKAAACIVLAGRAEGVFCVCVCGRTRENAAGSLVF